MDAGNPLIQYGDPRLPQRVWNRIYPEPNTGCWLWSGRIDGKGYGWFTFEGKRKMSHRILLKLDTGKWGDYALHSCRTPSCCNPAHLRWGNNSENQLDSVNHGTHHLARKTHCKNGHEFTEDNIYRRPDDPRSRGCKACRNRRRATH